MWYEAKPIRCNNGCVEYSKKTFLMVLPACGTIYEPCPPYTHHTTGVDKHRILTITEKVRSMMINSQPPLVFWGEVFNTAVYLHQQTPTDGLRKSDGHDSYQASYSTPYQILQAFGKPFQHNDVNEITYKSPLHYVWWFSCNTIRFIPEPQ